MAIWCEGQLVAGHGVASGRSLESPYPAGTISLQAPCFRQLGLDLDGFQLATLNLDFSPGEWRLRDPDHTFPQLRWTDRHPPETFSFWRCRLRRCSQAPAQGVDALVYYPHPETKRAHHQHPALLEVLAPPLGPVAVADCFALELDPRRCRLIQPARLRARLLEFLKFRVLAAQDSFFDGSDLPALRAWLQGCWPEACDLADADLERTLEQARRLYTEGCGRGAA
jgi:hypothetical protein